MKRIFFFIGIITMLSLCSCSKYVDISLPEDELISSSAFKDDGTATAVVTGIYISMDQLNYYFPTLLNMLTAMSAHEYAYAASFDAFDQFSNNAVLPSNSYLETLWSQPYNYIYQANACIEGLPIADQLSGDVKAQLLGEAYFIRAFTYFYLVNLFGDVPLVTTTDYKINNVMPRTPATQVYDTIISDLTRARNLMLPDYPGNGERIRADKAVATALLARVYLYRGQWAEAEEQATEVINNSQYKLDTLNGVFLKNSNEAIWQLQPVSPGRNTWLGSNIVPFSVPYYRLTDNMVNAFEPGDLRFKDWTGSYVSNGKTVYYPYKYKVRTGSDLTEYTMVLRLGEQYLIRADARIQQDKLDQARADIDTIRHRAGLPSLPAGLDKEAMLLATEHERRTELFSEWGDRWFNLKRTGRIDAVMNTEQPGWKPTAALYPIPENAIKTNHSLTQNPGY
jgi:hypothetical protein